MAVKDAGESNSTTRLCFIVADSIEILPKVVDSFFKIRDSLPEEAFQRVSFPLQKKGLPEFCVVAPAGTSMVTNHRRQETHAEIILNRMEECPGKTWRKSELLEIIKQDCATSSSRPSAVLNMVVYRLQIRGKIIKNGNDGFQAINVKSSNTAISKNQFMLEPDIG